MKKTVKLAAAFVAFATMAGSVALAGDRAEDRRGRDARQAMIDRIDADDNGQVTFEEFSNALSGGLVTSADADGDQNVTVEELAGAIMRQRAERRARRMIERFDVDGDGTLSLAEYEKQQRKHFALFDRNDDGILQEEELRFAHARGHGRGIGFHDDDGRDTDRRRHRHHDRRYHDDDRGRYHGYHHGHGHDDADDDHYRGYGRHHHGRN